MPQLLPKLRGTLQWIVPPVQTDLPVPAGEFARLEQTREQLVTSLSRIMSLLSIPLLIITIPPVLAIGTPALVFGYLAGVIILWLTAINRKWPYHRRGLLLLCIFYLFGIIELVSFGFTEDAHSYLFFTSVLATLLIGQRAGVATLALCAITLLGFGLTISQGAFHPLAFQMKALAFDAMIITWLIFVSVAAILQVGILALSRSTIHAWHDERRSYEQLEQERALLEERVAGRTMELATARDMAIAASNEWSRQNQYLETLHDITIDLLNRRERDDLLRAIVEQATSSLNARYGQILLGDTHELVVHAYAANQAFMQGKRILRGESLLSWQAYDTQQPVVLDDYSEWTGRQAFYDGLALRAVADFPIVVRDECLGILALARTQPAHPFSAEEIRRGVMLARLVAVLLDSVRQYELTQHEAQERQRALAALEETAADLRAQNAELDAFAHTVAHDIKNPLFSVVGFIQLLQLTHRDLSAEEIDAELARILRAGFNIGTIIDELLMLASMRSSDTVELTPLDMGQIVERLDERLSDLIVPYGASITYPAEWPVSFGHESWVAEVWANYVSNAIKYGGSPPVVVLGADSQADGMVRFWVRDNGAGLSSEQQRKLFTAFTRLHIDQAPGTGLGLSIVQRIIEKLGGQVGVESEPGAGSTFFFTLPAALASGDPSPNPGLNSTPALSADNLEDAGRVLIAEDNLANQLIAYQMATRLGYAADIVANGHEAVAACQKTAYAYILMDLQMPEMDGVTATQQIRALGEGIVQPWIIALSAGALPSEYARLRAAGIDDFLRKPVTVGELREAFTRRDRAELAPILQ